MLVENPESESRMSPSLDPAVFALAPGFRALSMERGIPPLRREGAADALLGRFILESLPEMPLDALHEAGDALAQGLRAMMSRVHIETTLIAR